LNILNAHENFALHLTLHAIATQSQWPFVTSPNFAAHAGTLLRQTGSNSLTVTPIVRPKHRDEWGRYSVAHQVWLQEGFEYMMATTPGSTTATTTTSTGAANTSATAPEIVPYIWSDFETLFTDPGALPPPLMEPMSLGEDTDDDSHYFCPFWQSAWTDSPNIYVNYDAVDAPGFNVIYEQVLREKTYILSHVNNDHAELGSWPESYMVVPIFNHTRQPGDIDDSSGKVVATLVSLLPWHKYFDNLVPEGIDGIYLVVRDTCSNAFTYMINGPVVDYLGAGDWHEPYYNDLEVSTNFTMYTTGATIAACQNTLHIYPSHEFHSTYVSRKPLAYTGAAIAIFLLTALVFIVYDWLVEKRQDKVMTTATRSTAIVSSLFPENFRDRIMVEQQQDNADSGDKGKNSNNGDGWKLDHIVGRRSSYSSPHHQQQRCHSQHPHPQPRGIPTGTFSFQKPIADLFPNTTVLFGDIAGFTAWASVREPSHVFTLLESLYNCFDGIANRHQVFKVETIGDCYVATTGLPVPMDDHAVVMARFAKRCLKKMAQVTRQLETTLGTIQSDTPSSQKNGPPFFGFIILVLSFR
jgi:hypothetical protein